MEGEDFRLHGKGVIDFVVDYLENIRDRKVFPDQKPGFLKKHVADSAPVEGESWSTIYNDFENIILPGATHWQSPQMHAYFPALTSYPSMLGDMLSNAINCLGFTWASSPVMTELEILVMNWLGKMIGLPDQFLLLDKNSLGGGVIQTTASEATLTCLLAGRTRAIEKVSKVHKDVQPALINTKLVAYCSDQAHSSVEKAGLIALIQMRFLSTDENLSLRGDTLLEAIRNDKENGLLPFWVCVTLGSTGACAFDNLDEITNVAAAEGLWVHIDAAYAGSAFICPEYRTWLKGVEKADSIAFNPSKWLMVHFDCTAMWLKDASSLHKTFCVKPLYLEHENTGLAVDYMHWQIPLSRRFRSLKLWFVIRNYGITGLQKHIRKGVCLAQKFEALVRADHRFEIPAARHLGMVIFRLKGEDTLTEELLKRTNSRRNIHCVPACIKGKYVIRFTVTSQYTVMEDILKDWKEIKVVADEVLSEFECITRPKVPLKETKNTSFGTSLLLCNSPMSPKIINGSFAAILNRKDVLTSFANLKAQAQNSPHMRRRIKGILMSGKQFSLDSHLDLFHAIETIPRAKSTATPSTAPPPLLEALGEYDEADGEEKSNGDQFLAPQKRDRSKSVDHQISPMIQNQPCVKCIKCTKCGHDLEKHQPED